MRLIDWEHPENNDFALAEEVTLKGGLERRPDLVIYLNGVAIGVMELKNASTDIGTAEKYFLTWKEDEEKNTGFKLDKYLHKMCRKDRLLELLHDFVLFDCGVKKLPRVHQCFA